MSAPDWTDEMIALADRVANGALREVGVDNHIRFGPRGAAVCHLPLTHEEDEATERATDLGAQAAMSLRASR